jgi:1-acyl-sn-glycerol-3-phosphate acyltransferase
VRTLARRLVTIPAYLLLALASLLAAPLWIPLALAVDLLGRGRRSAARCGAFLTFYLQCGAAGLLASGLVWLARIAWPGVSRERYLDWNFRLQCAWAGALYAGARGIFGFELEVEGAEAVRETPFLLFPRHASIADTVLPIVLVSAVHGTRLRYVLKRELLLEPCLDVVGNRLANYFVDREAERSELEVEAVRRLAQGLGPGEALVLYPEGTRFSAAKRERVLARLRERADPDFVARAERLGHVLPPRLGGPLACLEGAPGADCVFCAHTGFEGAARFSELWRGGLTGRRVRVRFWRVPRAGIPASRSGRIDWLLGQWERVDAFVGGAAGGAAGA